MLFCIVGKSGSGKSYLVNKACEKLGTTQVKSYTTRAPRENDDTHTFVTEEQFQKIYKDLVAYTYFSGNHYGATRKQCNEAMFYVIDFDGLKELKEKYDEDIYTIYIGCELTQLVHNMIQRGDKRQDIMKRIHDDNKEFNLGMNQNIKFIDCFFTNNGDEISVQSFIELVENVLNKK